MLNRPSGHVEDVVTMEVIRVPDIYLETVRDDTLG